MQILDAIKTGQIHPGERLIERDLADRFHVSRAPVRDAIKELEKLGVVVSNGAKTTSVEAWTDKDVEEIENLIDALNLLAVQLCVGRLAPDDIAALDSIVAETAAAAASGAASPADTLALELKFHDCLAQLAGHRRLLNQFRSLALPMQLQPQRHTPRQGITGVL